MKNLIYLFSICLLLLTACNNDDEMVIDEPDKTDLTGIPYNPQAYVLTIPTGFPQLEIPADNALTMDGVNLGRHLFYDPILSADSTMSCSSCHLAAGSFTDNKAVSIGIDGIGGTRSSMALLNVGFFTNGLFWDGRSPSLEAQALLPVEDVIELHNTWPNVVTKLKAHEDYPTLFRKAFGIANTAEISKELAAKAIAQFERIMVSSGKSRYDLIEAATPGMFYTEEELHGRELFFFESGAVNHPGCSHCHNGPLLTTNQYENNGTQQAATLEDYPDKGRGMVTGDVYDNGKFRVPTLRNIDLSAPYMHNGQFETLEEVIDHYASGGFPASNTNPLMIPFTISDEDKADLIAFIKTFTDMEFVNNPDLQNPFE
jgi:cytochrome c peroxidase